jgi:hypothetical protein
MSMKKICAMALALSLVALVATSCKRNEVTEPDPFGPGSFQLTFDLSATPNVLYTSTQRQQAEVTATVKWGGTPAVNQMVVFTISSGLGEFSNLDTRIAVFTDSSGIAAVTYISPTSGELSRDTYATIKAQVQTTTPYYALRFVDIWLLMH